jgi:hypothetical protein
VQSILDCSKQEKEVNDFEAEIKELKELIKVEEKELKETESTQ